jgi:uncharacterized cupin superfamily protein
MAPINEAAIEWTDTDREEMTVRRKQLSEAAPNDRLGCSLYELPAGANAWPYHYHTANEEALFVLAGRGQLRIASEATDSERIEAPNPEADTDTRTVSIEAGDYAAFPADATGGHQVINDSDDLLRYLAISTMADPDVTVYPDSGKLGVFVGSPPGGRDPRSLHGYYRIDDDVDYWTD